MKEGELILESKFRVTKDEKSFFTNHKTYTSISKLPGGFKSEFHSPNLKIN